MSSLLKERARLIDDTIQRLHSKLSFLESHFIHSSPLSLSILGDINSFLYAIFNDIESCGIHSESFFCDHVCYRVETKEEYKKKKEELLKVGHLLIESQIGGKDISTFKLFQPIVFEHPVLRFKKEIPLVELPSPKKGSFYSTGLEHIELVIPDSFEDFMCKYPHLTFDIDGMKKSLNADIQLDFDKRSVKFHHLPLEKVIEIEKEMLKQEKH